MKKRSLYMLWAMLPAMAVAICGLSSCKKNEFRISGEITGAEEKSVVLEKADFHGRWIALDSAKIGKNGKFEIEAAAPSSPEIYRLAYNDRYIYLPVDSTESLSVTSSAGAFGHDFSVTGSAQAERMADFEKELLAVDFNDREKVEAFKREVYSKYLKDARGGIISYYILTKFVGDKPLYDPENQSDAKYYAAVATSFEQFRPDDPRTGMLKAASIEALKRKNSAAGKRRVVEAEEIKLIDIDLPDEKGTNKKLSEVLGNGKRGVMIVSMMNEKQSPVVNKALSDIYNSKGGSVEFYMVSLDRDRYAWRDAAVNLPWITVFDQEGRSSDIVTKYNIGVLPAFFIFNAEGALVDRAFSIEELKEKL